MYRETDERTVDDVWRISMLQPADRTENCGFPTQKPEALLQRIVQAASCEGDLVADFFCGSGTMLSVAEKLDRRWIGCDLGRWGIHATRKRLLGIKECRPFEMLSLGKYERRYWQGANFGERDQHAYVAFMLKLYGAQPVAGRAYIHGSKSEALVHVGAVDAPLTTACDRSRGGRMRNLEAARIARTRLGLGSRAMRRDGRERPQERESTFFSCRSRER